MEGTIVLDSEKEYEVKIKGKDLALITDLLEQRPYNQVKAIIDNITKQLTEK